MDSDIEQIRAAVIRAVHLVDDGQFQQWVACFTVDAEYELLGRVTTGRDRLRRMIERFYPPEERGKHMLGFPLVERAGDVAEVATDFIFVSIIPAPTVKTAGRYLDRMVRQGPDWLIASRRIQFAGPGNP